MVQSERLQTRGFIYGNITKVYWLTVLLILFAEYRAAKWLNQSFSLTQPLSGTGALVMFGILIGTVVVVAELGFLMLTYWFPYFEIEGNISRDRTAARKFIAGITSTVYTGAILNALILIFGHTFASWIGH